MPKEFGKYLDTYIWLNREPIFGTLVLNPPCEIMPEYISEYGDLCTSELESNCTISNVKRKQERTGQDRAKDEKGGIKKGGLNISINNKFL